MGSDNIREIRINPIIPAESVLITTERSNRPEIKKAPILLDRRPFVSKCPFCPGNEVQTPEEILRVGPQKDWEIRVVKNLYPAFGDDSELSSFTMGVHNIISGYGQHEVIVDHRQHGIRIDEMTETHLAELFRLYRDRMSALYSKSSNHTYVMIFKNFGPASGGSIAHTHSQVIAMPVIPINVEMEITSSLHFYQQHHRCIFCTLIDRNLCYEAILHDKAQGQFTRRINVRDYVVAENDKFISIKPFASRYPWELHILPKIHSHDFRSLSDEDCIHLASILKNIMARLEALIGPVQYNYFLHSSPGNGRCSRCAESFHWHLEICPRTSIPNGFEIGSGLIVNTVSPEKAAEQLRRVYEKTGNRG